MARVDMPPEHLSDYERAICYYTLPKIANPITLGLVIVYVVLLVEAVGVVVYGLAVDADSLTRGGAVALGIIVVLGIVTFMLRALMHEVRLRRALAVARGVPDAIADIEDLPDPFAAHLLIRHPLHARGDLFPCTDNANKLMYFVESAPHSPWWKVRNPHDEEVLRVHVQAGSSSFLPRSGVPSRLSVFVGNDEVARIHRRFSLAVPTISVSCLRPAQKEYTLQRGSIFSGKRLVGRIYYLHRSLYLDIEKDEFHEAILGLFITMT